MSTLSIVGLRASVAGHEVLQGIDLKIEAGEIHAVMGPNRAGKSTLGNVLMGDRAYEVLAGSVTLDGLELLGLDTYRPRAGRSVFCTAGPDGGSGRTTRAMLTEALIAQGRTAEALPAALSVRWSKSPTPSECHVRCSSAPSTSTLPVERKTH